MSGQPIHTFEMVVTKNNPIIRDHRVHEVRILPGVTLLDMTYRFGNKVLGHSAFTLEQVLFKQPIAAHETFDQKLRILFENRSDSTWQVQVQSRKINADQVIESPWVEIMQCRLSLLDVPATARPAFDLHGFIETASRQWDVHQLYEQARAVDIWHGPFMKTSGTIYQRQNERLVVLHLSALAEKFRHKFYAHPAFLDGTTLTGLPTDCLETGITLYSTPYIPFIIRRFGIYQPFPQTIYVYTHAAEAERDAGAHPDLVTCDMLIYDEAGQLIAEFDNLTSKRIREIRLIRELVRQEPVVNENAQKLFRPALSHSDTAPAVWNSEDKSVTLSANPGGGVDKEAVQATITTYLQEQTAQILSRNVAEITPHTSFYELGMESTQLLALTKELENHYGLELYPTLLFEYTTIADLAKYLAQVGAASASPQKPTSTKLVSPREDAASDLEKVFYRPVWKPQTLTLAANPPSRILLYSSEQSTISTIKHEIMSQPDQGRDWIFVSPGQPYQEVEDNHYVLNPDSEAAWSRLLTGLREKNRLPDAVVCVSTQPAETFEPYLQGHLYPLFQLTSSLIKAQLPQTMPMLYLYQDRITLTTCFEQALAGFGATLEQEHPKLRFKTVGVDPDSDVSLSALIKQEVVGATDQGRNIRYRDGIRQAQSLVACTGAIKAAALPVLRQQGTYFITGGGGGLGLILAEGLLRNYDANVILVGRSPLNAAKAARLEQLNQLGTGSVVYLQADLTSLEEMTVVVNHTQSQYGQLHGVIHAAGVIQDSLIPYKTLSQLRTVIAPKVIGAIHLDQLLAPETLDFFVLFSSTTAIWGNMGQADYGYANRFLDAFAGYRQHLVGQSARHGQTVSINWPLWENGGMQPTPEIFEALAGVGWQPLDDQTGWQAFEQVVNQQVFQQLLFLWQRGRREAAGATEKIDDPLATMPFVPSKTDQRPAPSSRISIAKQGATDNNKTDIAIIGLSGRYPQAETLAEFWQNLKQGRDCISEIPTERWDWRRYHKDNQPKSSQNIGKWGGFMADVDKFDPLFFNISPREAEIIDPQERLFLETAWQTLEDAGYTRQMLQEQYQGRVGVFVGVMWGEYQLYGQPQVSLSSSHASIANRVSYHLDLHGPSLAVDTMCSSSLTSIHLACESIKRGECAVALAGGVNISIHPNKYLQLSQSNFMASDGRCRSFGEGGDGYVPGEGVGAVLLKPLAQAEADGDQIYGLIKASSFNHGGKSQGYTVPNPVALRQLMADTLRKSGIPPESLSYIEAHGTGTALGDPMEIRSLSQALGEDLPQGYTCAIGSIKSNIGHLEAAAGIAGLTKVLLQMKYRQLVPSLHAERLNPYIDLEATPFQVQRELIEWKQPVIENEGKRRIYPLRAGINTYGAGGANAHLIVEAYQGVGDSHQKSNLRPEEPGADPQLIVLSAKSEERLRAYAHKMLNYLEQRVTPQPTLSLTSLAYTLQVGREAMKVRLAIVVSDLSALREKLAAYLADADKVEHLYRGQRKPETSQLTVFAQDEDLQAAISQWTHKGKLSKLAELWVAGVEIDWRLLYPHGTPRRVSLPTYPFAKERCWLPNNGAWPMGNDQISIDDHRVRGEKVLPGVETLSPDMEISTPKTDVKL
ncbi:MAG: SDR family NAD(P)-dependent oxidoreductase, partial [Anaerolineae bacterium]|nr:SDR family NAD(P)-dependent oxidoreductase [Anaerolineae bacterium]